MKRLSVDRSSIQPKLGRLSVGNVYIHPQQARREGLSLRVCHKAERSATAQAFMQQKIERAEVRQLKAVYAAFHHRPEMLFDAFGRDLANEQRIIFVPKCDKADVCGVAFVARAGVGELYELDIHIQGW